MMTPFEFAVIEVSEARLLMRYIETSTAAPGLQKNYERMQEKGVMGIYEKLRNFVEAVERYERLLWRAEEDD